MSDYSNYTVVYSEEYAAKIEFENFKRQNPDYLNMLNNRIKELFTIYSLIRRKRYKKLAKNTACFELAKKCGYGMLMRHALEVSVRNIAIEIGIDVGGKDISKVLEALSGQTAAGYDVAEHNVNDTARRTTNDLAHTELLERYTDKYCDLTRFYETDYKQILEKNIDRFTTLSRESRRMGYHMLGNVSRGGKYTAKYLVELKKRLDNFSITDKLTNALLKGCLVRLLTECAVNLWCYNFGILPTDASTKENQIKLSGRLDTLAKISKAQPKNGAFGHSAINQGVISNLFNLKNASNCLMHVESYRVGDIIKLGKALDQHYPALISECSPYAMRKKFGEAMGPDSVYSDAKSPLVATLLCGLLGWFGAHHFYVGNIGKAISYLLFGGFIFGPIRDLRKLKKGELFTPEGSPLKRTKLVSFLASVFIIFHLVVIYNTATNLSGHIRNLIPQPAYVNSFISTTEKSVEGFAEIKVKDYKTSSHLSTKNGNYDANYCLDNNKNTCWQDGVEGNGEEETLTFYFEEEVTFTGLAVLNGKQNDKQAYNSNAKICTATVTVGGISADIEFSNQMEMHYFVLDTPVNASEITITINKVYSGTKFEDLCISEIDFYTNAPSLQE